MFYWMALCRVVLCCVPSCCDSVYCTVSAVTIEGWKEIVCWASWRKLSLSVFYRYRKRPYGHRNSYQRKHLLRACLQFTGLVYSHGRKHGKMQTEMVLKKKLRVSCGIYRQQVCMRETFCLTLKPTQWYTSFNNTIPLSNPSSATVWWLSILILQILLLDILFSWIISGGVFIYYVTFLLFLGN